MITNCNRKPTNNNKTRCRQRKVVWFNPPYNANVHTNVGKQFMKIVNICFTKGHVLNKIFNKNTLKLSYSCMSNMKNAVDSHNKQLLTQTRKTPVTEQKTCN